MWNKKYAQCQSCSSTLYKHRALGFCERCYIIENNKKKLKKELKLLSTEDLIKSKIAILPTFIDQKHKGREEMIYALMVKEDYKLRYLKLYGKYQRGETIDYLKFENIFNLLSKRINGKYLFNHGLNTLYSSLNEKQQRILLLEILKLLDKVR
jgi:hypothetical protein